MSGALRSLRDWLADQVAELRNATPLSVLDTPQPQCAVGRRTRMHEPPCDGTPVVLARVQHVSIDGERRCDGAAVVDFCADHHAELVAFAEHWLCHPCGGCGFAVLEVPDMVRPVITR